MPKATKGILVECDPSIKAIINKIDEPKHDYIVQDIDDQTVVIKENMIQKLKARLQEELETTQQQARDSDSDSDARAARKR